MRNNQKVLGGIAILLLLLFFGYIFVYESFLRDLINKEEVVVATRDIEYNDIITEDDVTIQSIERDRVTNDMFRSLSQVVGQRAVSYIPQYGSITPKMIDSAELITGEDERFLSIPGRWIESIPGSLRRLDVIDIWLVNYDNEDSTVRFSTTEPFLTDKVVAYVKNARNNEVTGLENPNDRLDAESSLQDLEIIATQEEINNLKEAYENGYRIIVTYKDVRS